MITEVIEDYFDRFPEDRERLSLLNEQIERGDDLIDRGNFAGHFTAGGLVFPHGYGELLLVHHIRHDRWMHPGGHGEKGEANPVNVAIREIREETGLEVAYLTDDPSKSPWPIYIETRYVQARPQTPSKEEEPEHFHHNLIYPFIVVGGEVGHQEDELHDVGWFALHAAEVEYLQPALERVRTLILPHLNS